MIMIGDIYCLWCLILSLSLSLYIYIYIYTCVYIYIYMHTYIHIYMRDQRRGRRDVGARRDGPRQRPAGGHLCEYTSIDILYIHMYTESEI